MAAAQGVRYRHLRVAYFCISCLLPQSRPRFSMPMCPVHQARDPLLGELTKGNSFRRSFGSACFQRRAPKAAR
jgi:hypothetical protein